MKKILLAEQWGSCDAKGQTIGHTSKVLKEYFELLKDFFEIRVIAHPNLVCSVNQKDYQDISYLKYCICEEEKKGILKRLQDKIKLFMNIHKIWNQKGNDIIWFFRGDFFLLLYAIFSPKVKGTKYYCLIYHNQYGKGLVNRIIDLIYRVGIKRFDGIIYTQEKMCVRHNNAFYMPDYLYCKENYDKYIFERKTEKAVCVGTMNHDKDIEGLVFTFNENGYPLEIMGRFMDSEYFKYIKSIAKENVIVENIILSVEEYNSKLGEAKYSVVPYKMSAYNGRTSGVLLESLFLNTIPIAPKQLLEDNNIPGIGYDDLIELEKRDFWGKMQEPWNKEKNGEMSFQEKRNNILWRYEWQQVKKHLVEWMNACSS